MFINLLIFLIVIALTVGAGWLTWRATHAHRLWVKMTGGLGAGLLTLVLVAVTLLGGKGIAMLYFPSAPPISNLNIEGTPGQVARGEYLANIGCVDCHSPNGELPLSGGADFAAQYPVPIGSMVPSNLTPGGALATLSNGELFRVIRYGVGKDGRLSGAMVYFPFRQLSDEDTKAIIAYLRSQPAVQNEVRGGDKLNFLAVLLFPLAPLPAGTDGVIVAPPAGPTAEYGQYVANFGTCRGCHGPDMTGSTDPGGFVVPSARPLVSALSQEQFVEMMHTGIRPGGDPFSEAMPWQNAAKMTDDDLAALYAYLTAPIN